MNSIKLTENEWNTILRALSEPTPGIGPDFHSEHCKKLYEKIKKSRRGDEKSIKDKEDILKTKLIENRLKRKMDKTKQEKKVSPKTGEDILKEKLKEFPQNQFVQSCETFFKERGFLSKKQIDALFKVSARSYRKQFSSPSAMGCGLFGAAGYAKVLTDCEDEYVPDWETIRNNNE